MKREERYSKLDILNAKYDENFKFINELNKLLEDDIENVNLHSLINKKLQYSNSLLKEIKKLIYTEVED